MWLCESLPAVGRCKRPATAWPKTLCILAFAVLVASASPASAETWRNMLEAVLEGDKKEQKGEIQDRHGETTEQDGAVEDRWANSSSPDHTDTSVVRPDAETNGRNNTTQIRSENPDPSGDAGPVPMSEGGPTAPQPVAPRPSRPIPNSADLCYQELASIGSDSSSLKHPYSYFKHVYQYIDTPPYYRYVGPASIGIKREPKSAPMYQIVEGRKNVGKDHYALLTPYGKGVVSDVEIDVGLGRGEFAYLFFKSSLPSKPHNNTRWRRWRYNEIAAARVATTVGGEVVFFYPSELTFHSHSFYKVKPGMKWRRAESPRDLWRGERRYFKTPDSVDYLVPDSKTAVRTISTEGRKTTRIAGMDRTQKVFCRYRYSPLAFTNHDVFLPAIERELKAWVKHVIEPLQHEPLVEIPNGHVGDFVHRHKYGTISIRFDEGETKKNWERSVSYLGGLVSSHKYVVQARLDLFGRDFGVVGEFRLGKARGPRYGRQPWQKHWDKLEERLKRGRFTLDRLFAPKGSVPVRFRCFKGKCVLEVQRWYLDKIRRYSSR